MLKIKLISVGKIKEKALREIIAEYEKRLSKYVKYEAIILNDLSIKESPKDAEIKSVIEKEGKDILKHTGNRSFIIAMCIEGKKIDSVALAQKIENLSINNPEIDFIIGGSLGLSDEVKNKSNMLLSMSDMTFPHNIAKLMLTEQIYRACKIISNETYHK